MVEIEYQIDGGVNCCEEWRGAGVEDEVFGVREIFT